MEGIQLAGQVTPWLASGRTLFLIIHLLGITSFAYIVARRLVPLLRAERDFRFDRHLARLGKVLKFGLGQWNIPATAPQASFIFSFSRDLCAWCCALLMC